MQLVEAGAVILRLGKRGDQAHAVVILGGDTAGGGETIQRALHREHDVTLQTGDLVAVETHPELAGAVELHDVEIVLGGDFANLAGSRLDELACGEPLERARGVRIRGAAPDDLVERVGERLVLHILEDFNDAAGAHAQLFAAQLREVGSGEPECGEQRIERVPGGAGVGCVCWGG